jgi:hypothetical protein
MTLSGLNRSAARPRGGIARVDLVTTTDATGPASIVESIGASGAGYAFREDGANYSETLTGDELHPLVKHTLTMEFPAGRETRLAVDQLMGRSSEGFVALITHSSGERLVVGYSTEFGTKYPLRVKKLSSASGETHADFPSISLTLECCDGALAINIT